MPPRDILKRLAPVVLVAGLLVGCGESDEPIPAAAAQALVRDLAAVEQTVRAGECERARSALARLDRTAAGLPEDVQSEVRATLDRGVDRLGPMVRTECKPKPPPEPVVEEPEEPIAPPVDTTPEPEPTPEPQVQPEPEPEQPTEEEQPQDEQPAEEEPAGEDPPAEEKPKDDKPKGVDDPCGPNPDPTC